jgi:hypothetical protein
MKYSIRFASGIALTMLIASAGRAQEAPDVKAVLAIVQKHCVDCHGADVQRGGVRLDKLTGGSAEADTWSAAVHQVQIGMMPPKKKERLSARKWLAWFKRSSGRTLRPRSRWRERWSDLKTATTSRMTSCSIRKPPNGLRGPRPARLGFGARYR